MVTSCESLPQTQLSLLSVCLLPPPPPAASSLRFAYIGLWHNYTTNLRDSLNDLEKQLSNDPSDKYLQNEINKTKKELEISELEKTRGAQLRARIKWAEEGERGIKFFLNLEKSRAQGITIHRLVEDDGSFLNTSGAIIKEVHRYYKSLYKETKEIDEIAKATLGYARNLTFPKVSEQDKAKTEEELTETELSSALQTMKMGLQQGLTVYRSNSTRHFGRMLSLCS